MGCCGANELRNYKADPAVVERALVPVLFVAVAAGALLLGQLIRGSSSPGLTVTFLAKQDIWLVLAGLLILLASLFRLPPRDALPKVGARTILLALVVMAIAAWAGRYFILFDYDMSRDEQMASFDAIIFSTGQHVAQLSEPWREYTDVLNTIFMLPVADRHAWASGYLPMNSAIRAVFELVNAANLVGPLVILLGGAALWACARKIWPDDRTAAVLALILYVGSGQVLLNGMTSYAMPLHLTANLIWLWLFLQNKLRMDLLALCVAFVTVGLHQPPFHPMFALPILIGVVIERDWRRAAIYFFGYLAIGAFWLWWPSFAAGLISGPSPSGQGVQALMVAEGILQRWSNGLGDMIANLVRFATWQHLLLVPLMLIGVFNLTGDRLMAGIAGGIVLTIIVVAIMVPYQGHGFGYRYLHGLIGNAILLAVFGWQKVRGEFPQWNALIIRTTAGGLLFLLPMQLYFAHQFYAPFAQASRAIDNTDADYVLVRASAAPFTQDLVINDPYLRNRPIRLIEELTSAELLEKICQDGATVSTLPEPYYGRIRKYFIGTENQPAAPKNDKLAAKIREAGCLMQ